MTEFQSGLDRLEHNLRELIDERDRLYSERDAANKRAIDTALAATDRALDVLARKYKEDKDSQNEWRGTVNDIISKTSGSSIGMQKMWGAIVILVGLAVSLATFFKK
jgi:flagellar biosynthesis chaperone FliJ